MTIRKKDAIIAVVAGLGAAVIGNVLELLFGRPLALTTGGVGGVLVVPIVYWGRRHARSTA